MPAQGEGWWANTQEEMPDEATNDLVTGEWNHFTAVMPHWLSFLARLNGETQNCQR
jgi:hypothetical protein